MCGPATAPMTCAWTPRCPSASTSRAAVFSWPAVSGLTCSARRALEDARRRAGGTRRRRGRGARAARSSSSGSSALVRGGLGRRLGLGSGSGSAPRLGLGHARRRGDGGLEEVRVAQRAVELAGRVVGRMTTSSSSRSGGSSGWVGVGVVRLGSRRGPRRRAQRARRLDHLLAGGAQHARDRRAGQQQQARRRTGRWR